MTDNDKFAVKFSIIQTLTGKTTTQLANMLGYSRTHLYKVLAGNRSASTGVVDSLNALILFVYGSNMLDLINETINLVETTETGRLLAEGYNVRNR